MQACIEEHRAWVGPSDTGPDHDREASTAPRAEPYRELHESKGRNRWDEDCVHEAEISADEQNRGRICGPGFTPATCND